MKTLLLIILATMAQCDFVSSQEELTIDSSPVIHTVRTRDFPEDLYVTAYWVSPNDPDSLRTAHETRGCFAFCGPSSSTNGFIKLTGIVHGAQIEFHAGSLMTTCTFENYNGDCHDFPGTLVHDNNQLVCKLDDSSACR